MSDTLESRMTGVYEDLMRRRVNGLDGIRTEVAEAHAAFPDHQGITVLEAACQIGRGEYEIASGLLKEALARGPLDATGKGVMGRLEYLLARLDRADALFEEALAEDPRNLEALKGKLALSSVTGRDDERAMYAQRLLESTEEAPLSLLIVASTNMQPHPGETETACQAKLESKWPDYFGTYLLKARRTIRDRQPELAESAAQYAVAANVESADSWTVLALARVELGKWDSAQQAAEFAISLNRRQKAALQILAKVAKHAGNVELAQSYEQRAEAAIPMLAEFDEIRKANRLRITDRATARKLLARYVHSNNPSVSRIARRNVLRRDMWNIDPEQAAKLVEELEQELDPIPEFYSSKAWVLCQAEQDHEAEDVLNRGLQRFPRDAEMNSMLLDVYFHLNKTAEADALIQKVLAEPPNSPPQYVVLMGALLRHGRSAEAQALAEICNRRFPGAEGTELAQWLILVRSGRIREAIPIANRLRAQGLLPRQKISTWRLVRRLLKTLLGPKR